MGSGSSKKAAAADDSAAASSVGRCCASRSKRAVRVLKSSCFRPSSILDDQHQEIKQVEQNNACPDEAESKHIIENNESCRKLKTSQSDKIPSVSSAAAHSSEDDDHEIRIDHGASNSSSSVAAIHRSSSNTSGRAISPFHLMPDGTVSLGSSRVADNLLSDEEGSQAIARLAGSADNRGEDQENQEVSCNAEAQSSYRRLGQQEPSGDSIECRRTINVGRLRDRVHHSTSFSEGLVDPSLLEMSSQDYSGRATVRRAFSGLRNTSSNSSGEVLPAPPNNPLYRFTGLLDDAQHHGPESPQPREVNNRDFLEHASAFHERSGRVISQVRALQRLGSRFENLSGHQRSCILSGQYRRGRCTCRGGNRPSNHNDDAGTRVSISRIVLLAEALFEVLDEIHQQSELLSSRPSFSSIGSVPAPKEVVESMPTKTFTKPQKCLNEDIAQCYICLLEYEEGDCIRILPCNHEFHQTCIDKWLKEIHRVCPLCRGDVCKYEPSNSGKPS